MQDAIDLFIHHLRGVALYVFIGLVALDFCGLIDPHAQCTPMVVACALVRREAHIGLWLVFRQIIVTHS